MISVKEAQDIVQQQSKALESIQLPLAQALDFVLSENVKAPISLPPFDSSAMDGYALRYIDGQTAFELMGEVQAGSNQAFDLKDGQAVRIFTGAMVPETANAVIMQELTEVNGTTVEVEGSITLGSNIRRKSEQIEANTIALDKGTLLTASGIGFLASMGIETVNVHRKPKISLLITGNELVQAGQALQPGQIYESNGLTLVSAIKSIGFGLQTYEMVKDDFDATREALRSQLEASEVIIVSGGISVGDYDFVGSALEEIGVAQYFYKIKQKPGKPLFFGGINEKLCFALPGNPASALSCFYNYVLPALRSLSGWAQPLLNRQKMICTTAFHKRGDRAQFLKAKIEDNTVRILEGQGSAMLHSFALANAMVYLDEASGSVKPGDEVEVILLP